MDDKVRALGREESKRVKQERADQFAENTRWALTKYAARSDKETARNLSAARVPTATGKREWSDGAVRNVKKRLEAIDARKAERGPLPALECLDAEWEDMAMDQQAQATRYARAHGSLRGFQYTPTPNPNTREQMVEYEAHVQKTLAKDRQHRRDRIEALRVGAPAEPRYRTAANEIAYLEGIERQWALEDAGMVKRYDDYTSEEIAEMLSRNPFYQTEQWAAEQRAKERAGLSAKRKAEWAEKKARGGRTRKEEAARIAAELQKARQEVDEPGE